MKLWLGILVFAQFALAQTPVTSVPCIPPPVRPAQAAANGPARAPRVQGPQSAADIAEMAKLKDLPAWTSGAVDGDYSTGPGYPTAPELAKRVGVPEGKVIEFVMNSADRSRIRPRGNWRKPRSSST
ncbi:MAG: hypothetical protein M3N54_03730 [Acidobacteriota bacterium]|nr:hypothetical protein [Acidobacteriota bacterium]